MQGDYQCGPFTPKIILLKFKDFLKNRFLKKSLHDLVCKRTKLAIYLHPLKGFGVAVELIEKITKNRSFFIKNEAGKQFLKDFLKALFFVKK